MSQQNIPPPLSGLLPINNTKPSHLHTRGQTIFTLSLSSRSHSLILIFTSSITEPIYIENPRGNDTTLSHTTINPETLSPPFTPTQARLLKYCKYSTPFHSIVYHHHHTFSVSATASLLTLPCIFSKPINPTYILCFFSHLSALK